MKSKIACWGKHEKVRLLSQNKKGRPQCGDLFEYNNRWN